MDERTPVQVGIDLRPIPLEMSDGKTYHFSADPDAEFFSTVSRIKGDREDETDFGFVKVMRDALATQITVPAARTAFTKAKYGLAALNSLSESYTAAVLGKTS